MCTERGNGRFILKYHIISAMCFHIVKKYAIINNICKVILNMEM